MARSSLEAQFEAATVIIRNLPKNGPYQPSYTTRLEFYSLYKQATVGPCTGTRPPMWDIVARAKFDSWKALGHMDKETAMAKYVKKFIATAKALREDASSAEIKDVLAGIEPRHLDAFQDVLIDLNVPASVNCKKSMARL